MHKTEHAILFADVCRSTGLYARLGDEEAFSRLSRALEEMTRVVERSRGRVVKTIGDEIMAVFDSPDQAVDAARSLHEAAGRSLDADGQPLQLRVGLNAGEVVVSEDDAFGDAVNLAARLVARAAPGQTLTTRGTADRLRLHVVPCRELGAFDLGPGGPISIAELLWDADNTQLTAWTPRPNRGARKHAVTLRLEHRGRKYSVHPDHCPFRIGRSHDADLQVNHPDVSRRHLEIICRDGQYYLDDASTNGTFLRVGTGAPAFVHRGRALLVDMGWISLGRAFDGDGRDVVLFRLLGG